MFFKHKLTLPFVAVFLLTTFSFAETSVENLAKSLAALRTEIEQLHNQIEEIKDQIKHERKVFQAQKTDINLQIEREILRIKELDQELKKRKSALNEKSKKHKNVLPAVYEGIKILEEYISKSLPFKKEERLNQLNSLKYKIDNKLILPEKALNQLWAYYEDEIRLTKENGIYRDTFSLGGKPYLVDIAKQGMIGLFFKTSDNRYGVVRKRGDSYKISFIKDRDQQKEIDQLFEAYRKQIRTGYFRLPNFLPVEGK